MSAKSLFMVGALAVASVPLVYGASFEMPFASYEVAFATPIEANNTMLAPGAYRVEVKKGEAVFINVTTGAIYNVPATVEHLAAKNLSQHVVMNYQNGKAQIQSIRLGGHATDLQFAE